MIQTKTLKEALKDPGVIEVVEELLNNQYMQFDLVPNQKVYVSNRMGLTLFHS